MVAALGEDDYPIAIGARFAPRSEDALALAGGVGIALFGVPMALIVGAAVGVGGALIIATVKVTQVPALPTTMAARAPSWPT